MWSKVLKRLKQDRELVDIRRDALGASDVRGFVTALSEFHVLVSVVSDEVLPNGSTVLRMADITFLRWRTGNLRAWQTCVTSLIGDWDDEMRVDMGSWESIVRSVASMEPIVTFHREGLDAGRCYIGRAVEIQGGTVRAEEISTEGSVDGVFALRLDDLTRVDFGGNYEKALLRVLEGQ